MPGDSASQLAIPIPLESPVTERESEPVILDRLLALTGEGIITHDGAGTILAWNPAAERIFGISAARACGTPIQHVLPDAHSYIERSLREQAPAAVQLQVQQPGGKRLALT